MQDTQVLIVGAGPVGLTLALDLAARGVRATLVERNPTSIQLPKMERCNIRTMEIFRRLGIAENVRQAGLPRESPMDVFLADSMAATEAIVHLPYPSVAEAKATIAAHNDGRPLEPYQLISQYTLEPLLRSIAETRAELTIRFSCEMTSFTEDPGGITATLQTDSGSDTIRAAYIVGCDGGSSTVRKQLGIALSGQGRIRKLRQALFHAPDLYERIPMGKGRHYHIATGPLFPFIIIQDSTKHWTLHAAAETRCPDDRHLPRRARHGRRVRNEIGQRVDAAFTVRRGLSSRTRVHRGRRRAPRDSDRRARHEHRRRRRDRSELEAGRDVGRLGRPGSARFLRNRAARDRLAQRPCVGRRDGRAHDLARRRDARGNGRAFDSEQRKVTEIAGIEAGYRYVDSPVAWNEPGEGPDPDNRAYVPTTWPGFRLPHVWLADSTPIQDRLGFGYTLLQLGPNPADTSAFERELRATGAPLDVLRLDDAAAREIYARDLILVRPDLHVAWRGNAPPDDPHAVAATVTGRVPSGRAVGV